jgi:hypothetical protein
VICFCSSSFFYGIHIFLGIWDFKCQNERLVAVLRRQYITVTLLQALYKFTPAFHDEGKIGRFLGHWKRRFKKRYCYVPPLRYGFDLLVSSVAINHSPRRLKSTRRSQVRPIRLHCMYGLCFKKIWGWEKVKSKPLKEYLWKGSTLGPLSNIAGLSF